MDSDGKYTDASLTVEFEKTTANFTEIGRSGLDRAVGIVMDEFLPDLKGEKAIKVFGQMAKNDPIVGALLFAIEMLIRQVPWNVEADEGGEEAAEFLESCLDDMTLPWGETLTEVLSMLIYGWSFHEIVYKLRVGPNETDPKKRSRYTDNRIGWRKWAIRSQESLDHWEFDEEGGLKGMYQRPAPDYVLRYIPIEKALLFRTKNNRGSPEGESILRKAYKPYYLKKQVEIVEAIGIERDLAGLPEIRVPPNWLSPSASPEEKASLEEVKKIVRSIRRDEQEGIVTPALYDNNRNPLFEFKLVSTGGRRAFDTNQVIERHSRHIAMAALADFILLGHEKVGSYALSSDKTDLFGTALGTWLDSIADVVNRFAVPRLFELNTFPAMEQLPRIVHGDVESKNLSEIADFLKKLSEAGMPVFPNAELERHLFSEARLPVEEEL